MIQIREDGFNIDIENADSGHWVHFSCTSFDRETLRRMVGVIRYQFAALGLWTVYANIPYANKKVRRLAELLGFEHVRNVRNEDRTVTAYMRLDRQNVISFDSDTRAAE